MDFTMTLMKENTNLNSFYFGVGSYFRLIIRFFRPNFPQFHACVCWQMLMIRVLLLHVLPKANIVPEYRNSISIFIQFWIRNIRCGKIIIAPRVRGKPKKPWYIQWTQNQCGIRRKGKQNQVFSVHSHWLRVPNVCLYFSSSFFQINLCMCLVLSTGYWVLNTERSSKRKPKTDWK